MNRKALQKVIDELKSDKPRLDYVLGVLETLLESLPGEALGLAAIDKAIERISPIETVPQDEGTLLEREARARLAGIKVTYDN